MGARKQPFYRIVVADARAARDGRYVEAIGYYNPLREPADIHVDADRAIDWLSKGAQPSEAVKEVFRRSGVWERWMAWRASQKPAAGGEAGAAQTS